MITKTSETWKILKLQKWPHKLPRSPQSKVRTIFKFFRNLHIFKGRQIWAKRRKNYERWARQFQQTYHTFSPFGISNLRKNCVSKTSFFFSAHKKKSAKKKCGRPMVAKLKLPTWKKWARQKKKKTAKATQFAIFNFGAHNFNMSSRYVDSNIGVKTC